MAELIQVENCTSMSAYAPFAMLSTAWLQVHAQSVGYAAVQAAIFALSSPSSVIGQRRSVTAANVTMSSVRGGLVNVTTGGGSPGFATVTVDGRNKTIGATSAGADGHTTIIDFLSSTEPPVMNPLASDPTAGVPAPPVVSPTNATAPAGPAGELKCYPLHPKQYLRVYRIKSWSASFCFQTL